MTRQPDHLLQLTTALLLLLLPVYIHSLHCYTPLLRDVIAADSTKLRYTLDNIGESDTAFITGLPVLNSTHPLTIRRTEFTIASLLLSESGRLSPHYWITALDIQQGPAGRYCHSSAVIEEMSVEVREASGYRAIDTPFREGRDRSNSNPTINLKKLGGRVGNGRIVRFSLQPIAGDGVRMKILSIDPLSSSVVTEVCMRVEIYGCERIIGTTAPSVNSGPLHQYNLIQPTADTYGNLYTDPSYTGITSDGYQSGGTGILTDGVIGKDAVDNPLEWVGWDREATPEVEILFLFKRRHQIIGISLYYWGDEMSDIGTVRVSDQNNDTIPLNNIQVSNLTHQLKVLTLTRDRITGISYVKLSLQYNTVAILLTEIQIIGDVLGVATNILTGENITTYDRILPRTIKPVNHTAPTLNSTHSTTSTSDTSIQLVTTNTTQISVVKNTSLVPYTNTSQYTHVTSYAASNESTSIITTITTTKHLPNATTGYKTTTHILNTTSLYYNTSHITRNSSTYHHHTTTTLLTTTTYNISNEQTILLTALSATGSCLIVSICLNLILILILMCCCCYCCCRRNRDKLVIEKEGGRETREEEGTYVPMRSVQLRSYHNILDTMDTDSLTDTQEYHYYSKIDDITENKTGNPERNKYYPFS